MKVKIGKKVKSQRFRVKCIYKSPYKDILNIN